MDYELLSQILPKESPKWTINDVLLWLKFIGLDSLSQKFKNASIDGSCITSITEQDLRDQLEIKSSIILKKLNAWIKTGIKEYNQYIKIKLQAAPPSVAPPMNPNPLLQTQVNKALNLQFNLSSLPPQIKQNLQSNNKPSPQQQQKVNKSQLVLQQMEGLNSFYILKQQGGKIGRHSSNNILILQQSVSRHHAEIEYDQEKEQYFLKDIGSTTGTFIKLTEKLALEQNMLIQMGSHQFQIKDINDNQFKLVIIEGARIGQEFNINVKKAGLKLGRKQINDLSFPEDAHLSNIHCLFSYLNNKIYIEDYNTTNGTWLRLCPESNKSTSHLIRDKMVFKIGSTSTFMCYKNKPENNSSGGNDQCCICFDSERDCVFIPCKHNSTCVKCAKSFKECPICKIEIEDFIKIYSE